jgi:hypothetical protein
MGFLVYELNCLGNTNNMGEWRISQRDVLWQQ